MRLNYESNMSLVFSISYAMIADFDVRYSDMPVEEIQRICPACRGSCNCRVCMRGDNLIKVLSVWLKEP